MMKWRVSIKWSLFLFLTFDSCNSLPITGDISTQQGQWEYLKTYKHVPSSVTTRARSASTPDQSSFSAAVSAYQRFFQLPITGQVDSATLALMRQSRCSMPDDNENQGKPRFSIAGNSWTPNPLTFRLTVPPSDTKTDKCAARSRLIQAFQIWQYAIDKDFKESQSLSNIETSFVRGAHGDFMPFDGAGNTLAHAFFPQSGGDIHVDKDDAFSGAIITPANSHSMLNLYIHEIGHSLGLGHSRVKGAIMWPYMYHGQVFQGLNADDIAAIRTLYGTRKRPTSGTAQCIENTSGGSGGGAKCIFPFTYKGRTFIECTQFDHTKKWCSTTPQYIGLWGNCIGCLDKSDGSSCRSSEVEGTFLGTALGAPCHFPFTYKGVSYSKCTSVDHFRPWCSTSANFDGCWGNCAGCEEPPKLATCSETTIDGKHCVFPFFYKDKVHYSCTRTDHHWPWCSHTTIYTGGWSNCNGCPT